MNVAFLQENPGSRTCRIARALADAGHTCHLLTRCEPRMLLDAFASIERWRNPHDFARALLRDPWRTADVWHCHLDLRTEWLAPLAAFYRDNANPKAPRIVLDARDFDSLSPGRVLDSVALEGEPRQAVRDYVTFDELFSFRAAEGVIHVSERCQEVAHLLHHGPAQEAVIYSAVTRAELPELPDPGTRRGVVYAGGLDDAGSNGYRDWGRGFAVFGREWDLHTYGADPGGGGSRDDVRLGYQIRGVTVHDPVPDAELLRELVRYRWALVGFDLPFTLGDVAAPNKLFEAVAAGCPVLVHNCDQAATMVKQWGIGLVARDPASLVAQVAACTEERWLQMARRVETLREAWTQETQLPRLLNLYRKVMSRPLRNFHWLNAERIVYDWRQEDGEIYWPIELPKEAVSA